MAATAAISIRVKRAAGRWSKLAMEQGAVMKQWAAISIFAVTALAATAAGPLPPELDRSASLEAAIAADPARLDLRYELAEEELRVIEAIGEAGRMPRVEAAIAAAAKHGGDDFILKKFRARARMAAGDWRAAAGLARECRKRMPDDLESRGLLAAAELQLGNQTAAIEEVQWMLDLRPDDAMSFAAAADLRMALGQWDGAMRFLREAIARQQHDDPRLKARDLAKAAVIYRELGQPDSAKQVSAEASKLCPPCQLPARAAAGSAKLAAGQGP